MTQLQTRVEEIGLGKGWKGLILILCAALFALTSCTTMPTPEEMESQRKQTAQEDVNKIKPAMSYGNFGEKPLTLEDAIRYALDNNLELRIAKFNEEIAKEETIVEKLSMLPSLRGDASWRKRDELRKSDVYNWLLDRDEKDYTVSELKDNWWANLTLTWDILDTMMGFVRAGQREMKEEIYKQQSVRLAQQLALDVTRAYWHAAAVEDALDYVHVVENNLKQVKRDMDAAVKAGQLEKMAAADAELRLKELEMTIRQLQGNLSRERLELARLMGLNQNVQFTLARPPLKPIIAALPHTKDLNIDRLEEYALMKRPELYVSDLEVMIQKEEAKNKILAMFPGVNVFVGTHYEDNRLLHNNNWNSVGAGVSLELFQLPAKFAAYQGQEKAVEMAKAQRLMTTVGVITQVHIALLDYAIKVDRFRLLDETYKLANDLYMMADEKSKMGQLPRLAVTQRHLEEMAAKLRRDEAVVDLLVAHKRLCVTLGVNPLDCDASFIGGRGTAGAETYGYTESTAMKKWRCNECGHLYTGPEPPDVCPICGLGSESYVEVTTGESGGSISVGDTEDLSKWGADTKSPVWTGDGASKTEGTPGYAGPASDRFLWKVQLGAFVDSAGATKRMSEIKGLADRLLDSRDAVVTTSRVHGKTYNRVRIIGLTEEQARMLSRELEKRGMETWVIAPHSVHW